MCVDPYEKYSSELTPLLLGWRRCVVFDRRLLLSRRRRRRLSARPRSQSSAPRRSVGLAGNGTLPECLPEKLPNCSAARFFQSESLGPPEPRPSNILPSTTPKVSEKQVCPHAPVVGPSNGTCGGYATRRNQEILTGWATRAGPPSVWPPRFRHLESTILPRLPRSLGIPLV